MYESPGDKKIRKLSEGGRCVEIVMQLKKYISIFCVSLTYTNLD